ncbi:MAG: hypothetical protein FWB71_03900 [Defluviitaleaceae bacterium]|nr:hypothetical protein [Defluviitaleaceae bacterium]
MPVAAGLLGGAILWFIISQHRKRKEMEKVTAFVQQLIADEASTKKKNAIAKKYSELV